LSVDEESLGPEYDEPPILDLEHMWSESDPNTPLVCFLALGADPTTSIESLAKAKEFGKTNSP
jgi:dynein heavy chain